MSLFQIWLQLTYDLYNILLLLLLLLYYTQALLVKKIL